MKETEQTLLDQIKNQVASENFNKHRWDLLYPYEERELWPVVCERYATAKAQAILEGSQDWAEDFALGFLNYSMHRTWSDMTDEQRRRAKKLLEDYRNSL